MKIKVPAAVSGGDSSLTDEGLPLSHPMPTPGSPTSVTGEVIDGSSDSEVSVRRTRSGRKRQRPPFSARKHRCGMARLVSQDFSSRISDEKQKTPCVSSAGEEDDDSTDDVSVVGDKLEFTNDSVTTSSSPHNFVRCVTNIDANKSCGDEEPVESTLVETRSEDANVPLPNPLHCRSLNDYHIRALRLERELAPMRQILFRLMSNLAFNRRGLFNSPVDHVALGLADYTQIVTKPMDLGTVKGKLHALAYKSRDEVANDVRLVFQNAIIYNPSDQFVHVAASQLLHTFEVAYRDISNSSGTTDDVQTNSAASEAAFSITSTSLPILSTAKIGSDITVAPTNPVSSSNTRDAVPEVAHVATRKHADSTTQFPVHMNNGFVSAKVPSKLRPNRKKPPAHSCAACLGRTCGMCNEGCITHESTLLICNGPSCGCAKIRKNAIYYIAKDGTRQYCQKCYASLAAILPPSGDKHDSYGSSVQYKRDLLKRKNDEEIPERWLTCSACHQGVHQVCAMHNEFVCSTEDYVCPTCLTDATEDEDSDACDAKATNMDFKSSADASYSFVSGLEAPVSMEEILKDSSSTTAVLSADILQQTPVSAFIEHKVRERMILPDFPNADRTVTVRIISDCDKSFNVPDVVRKHFRMASNANESHLDATAVPPTQVKYKSIAIALFQKIDGVDVCIFCMYVQEYDGNDTYEDGQQAPSIGQGRRVYIAYLDSVEHFRPRSCRTEVYHEMLVAYLATARERGYKTAHIWACPPLRGNSFVFWNHPSSQRTPSRDRLISWYNGALSRAVECGVVTDVSSMHESAFQEFMSAVSDDEKRQAVQRDVSGSRPGRMVCPPLLDGDFWIEEAQRIHSASILRFLKSKVGSKDSDRIEPSPGDVVDSIYVCPALQVASLLRTRVMALPNSAPFRRPVNAAAMNLKDYHRVVEKPMDLGTIYSRCVLGEYESLREFMSDVQLVFENAKRFNPKGHDVHAMAVDVEDVLFRELAALVCEWDNSNDQGNHSQDVRRCWSRHADMSMSLDNRLLETSIPINSISVPLILSTREQALGAHSSNGLTNVNVAVVNEDDQKVKKRPKPFVESMRIDSLSPLPSAHSVEIDISVAASDAQDPPHAGHSLSTSVPKGVQVKVKCTRGRKPKPKPPMKKLDLLTDGGPEAVYQRMVGNDTWMLDKRNLIPSKGPVSVKKNGKRKKTAKDSQDEAPSKRRRQSWLGEEVATSMRSLRTSFFTCSLTPKTEASQVEKNKLQHYSEYSSSFAAFSQVDVDSKVAPSQIADARHALLEFSQYRNFEFDTLRRAKYSTLMLLYHLHTDDAPGLVPSCTSCSAGIERVRWHQIRKRSGRQALSEEELCSECYSSRPDSERFIPLPVSFQN